MSLITIEVGRLLCGELRDYLNKQKFKGLNISWIESTGMIEREFLIKGNNDDLSVIKKDFDKWMKSIEDEEIKAEEDRIYNSITNVTKRNITSIISKLSLDSFRSKAKPEDDDTISPR